MVYYQNLNCFYPFKMMWLQHEYFFEDLTSNIKRYKEQGDQLIKK